MCGQIFLFHAIEHTLSAKMCFRETDMSTRPPFDVNLRYGLTCIGIGACKGGKYQ